MGIPELKDLLKRYNNGTCTEAEKDLLESWYSQMELGTSKFTAAQLADINAMQAPGKAAKPVYQFRRWLSAAAAVLILGFGGIYLWQRQAKPAKQVVQEQNDVAPGGNKALLKLSNGETIVLDEAAAGKLSLQENVLIQKDGAGSVTYKSTSTVAIVNPSVQNSISTPAGGQYRVTLSDGTKVWLNASSSIEYPVNFPKNKREVTVSGEVYFEVQHNTSPFIVTAGEQVVEVLGTHFNVNAYADEPTIKTTLLEGSVKVSHAQESRMLQPGQQARVKNGTMHIHAVDTDAETAWKEGDFIFNKQSTQSLMRQLARWYDVEVDYADYTERNETFSGEISRSRNLSAVLRMLEKTNAIKFRIAGNRLYVIN